MSKKKKIDVVEELDKIKELERKIIQYKIAMNIQPLLSIEWIKSNLLNQNKDNEFKRK